MTKRDKRPTKRSAAGSLDWQSSAKKPGEAEQKGAPPRAKKTRELIEDQLCASSSAIGHGQRARLNSGHENIPLFDRNRTIPSSRPAVWQSAARSGSVLAVQRQVQDRRRISSAKLAIAQG